MKQLFPFFLSALALVGCTQPQTPVSEQREIVVIGELPNLPDGTVIGLSIATDTTFSEEVGEAVLADGRFTLRGTYGKPYTGMLTTNNLQLVVDNQWPEDSIRWNYLEVFVADDTLRLMPDLSVHGAVQDEYRAYALSESPWDFIQAHPQSVVSHWAASQLMKRAYTLRNDQVELLENTLKEGNSPQWWAEVQARLADARLTTQGSPLLDIAVADTAGRELSLAAQLPQTPFVLLDFWASWCGICLYQQPTIEEYAQHYAGTLSVVGISIDTDKEKWRNALAKHTPAWPQYITTPEGYETLFTRYQIGNGVPYYLLLNGEGNVITSLNSPEELPALLGGAKAY